MAQRIFEKNTTEEEIIYENKLRPRVFNEYIGQEKLKENLKVFIQAAKMRKEPLDHVLLHGAPGLGKTTLAYVIANHMEVNIKTTSGPAIERPIDMLVLLKNLKPYDILFIDEVHRLNKIVEEILYPAMEDFCFDKIISKGSTKPVKINLPPFTLIGATTRSGLISSPLRDRFGINFNISFYRAEDIENIILRSSKILEIEIDAEAAGEISRRSRGTPRAANRLLKRVRDFAQVNFDGKITKKIAQQSLENLGIDSLGLDDLDRRLLHFIIDKFKGGPVGIETLAAALNEDSQNLEEVYEPYLLQAGFLDKTSRGRLASPKAYEHLNGKPLA